jgi:carbonic anhydrase
MNNLDCLLRRNNEFTAQQSAAGTLMPSLRSAMPNVKGFIIACADMRTDPAHVLGIKSGEAVVLRNIGGRFAPGVLEELALLGRAGAVAGGVPGGGGEFHLIVLQRTDCGITRLAGDPAMLAHYFQIQVGELKSNAVTDPRAAVAGDVAALRAIPALPGAWSISGLEYHVATGLVEVVVPKAPIRTAKRLIHKQSRHGWSAATLRPAWQTEKTNESVWTSRGSHNSATGYFSSNLSHLLITARKFFALDFTSFASQNISLPM